MRSLRGVRDFSMIKTKEAVAMIGDHVDEELLLHNEHLASDFLYLPSSSRLK